MAAAWNTALDFDPPKVCVVIDKTTYTRDLVEASGEFVLNLPCRAQAALAVAIGSSSGRELAQDKFEQHGLATCAAGTVGAPLLDGCVGWLECRVLPEAHHPQRYDLFIGQVTAAWADGRVFADGHWLFDERTDPMLRTIHHVAGGHFFATGEPFSV
jgi:flavin reductase (DIM6/NTAB) family NADH-FMN oxidoreductase RutF